MTIERALADNNKREFNYSKLAEECCELSDVLLKRINKKKHADNGQDIRQRIAEELADVAIRMDVLIKAEDLGMAYKEAIRNKIVKLNGYLESNLYGDTV